MALHEHIKHSHSIPATTPETHLHRKKERKISIVQGCPLLLRGRATVGQYQTTEKNARSHFPQACMFQLFHNQLPNNFSRFQPL